MKSIFCTTPECTTPECTPRPARVLVGPTLQAVACCVAWAVALALPATGAADAAAVLQTAEPAEAAGPAEAAVAAAPFAEYLATWKIDRDSRGVLEEPSEWTPAKLDMALRVLSRLARAPANLIAGWNANAVDIGVLPSAQQVQDQLVKVEGRAKSVVAVPLSAEQSEVAGRRQLEQVRIVTNTGLAIDILADHVPKAWKRSAPIDEPTTVIGLPLAAGSGPSATPDAEAATKPASLLLAAARVGWFPPTPLAALGMDYGLFDSVADGQKLVAGDTEAVYAMLSAMGRATQAGIASAAGPPGDIVPLINPDSGWFAEHRGDAVTLEGIARRATRIEVDDPLRQQQLGTDHYWELYVFVPTPLIKVRDRLQEDYPVVYCVRTLPEGMPTGQQIGERVRVSGFALKRYSYPLPDVKITSSQGDQTQKGERQETALLIGKEPSWKPAPSPTGEVNTLGWIFLAIAAVIGLALALAAWSFARDSRRRDRQARRELPDRIELP